MIQQVIRHADLWPSRCATERLVFWGLWELK